MPGTIAAPLRVCAISAAPITSGPVPYRLEKRTWTVSPPILTWTTSRRVAPVASGCAPAVRRSSALLPWATSEGAEAHVPTQCFVFASGRAKSGCMQNKVVKAMIRILTGSMVRLLVMLIDSSPASAKRTSEPKIGAHGRFGRLPLAHSSSAAPRQNPASCRAGPDIATAVQGAR